MAKSRIHTFLALIVVAVGLAGMAVVGLFTYISVTTTPLHPDPQKVPSTTQAAPSPQWAGAAAQATKIVRAGLVEQNLPGLSVAVGAGGEIVYAEGAGWADLEKRVPATPRTRFRIGEVSKALTSTAVGLLVEKKELNLDDEIQEYVPEFPKKQWPVTLRQLMGQVAGLGDDPGDEAPISGHCERAIEGLPLFVNHKLLFEPGTRFHPSTFGWILVSEAVETAAHEPFFAFMRAQVFDPLGMAATRVNYWQEAIPDRATVYFPRFAGNTKYGPEDVREGDHSCFAGAGAFLSTPSDLVRFGMAVTRGTLLKPATVKVLQQPQELTSLDETGYGLGWKLETVELAGTPARMAGHGSKADFIGGSTFLMTFPENGIVVAVASNTSFADTKSIALNIAAAFAAVRLEQR